MSKKSSSTIRKKLKEQKGITLVALIITVIILLILAGVTIASITNGGIFTKSQQAVEDYKKAQIIEQAAIDVITEQAITGGSISDSRMQEILSKYGTVNKDASGNITGLTTEDGYEITLEEIYAGATVGTYTLSYNANEGTGAPASQTQDGNNSFIIPNTIPTKEGYKFTGWTDGQGHTYQAGETVTIANGKIMTLTAQWRALAMGTGTWTMGTTTENDETMETGVLTASNGCTINVGDYVNYTLDELNTTDYNTLISHLGTYSGNTNSKKNTTDTTKRDTLTWRVLDADDNGNLRLISDEPTTSTIRLYGYKGYNNAVYLLDEACSKLYNNSSKAEKVQNLKIEDIEKHMKTSSIPIVTTDYPNPTNKKYPSILVKEANQTVTADGVTQPSKRLGLSEQDELINQTSENTASSFSLTDTYWGKSISASDWKNSIYQNMYINKLENSTETNFPIYWMSSRCVELDNSSIVSFRVRRVSYGYVNASDMYSTRGDSVGDTCAFRPIITLKSSVKIVMGNGTGDAGSATNMWQLN